MAQHSNVFALVASSLLLSVSFCQCTRLQDVKEIEIGEIVPEGDGRQEFLVSLPPQPKRAWEIGFSGAIEKNTAGIDLTISVENKGEEELQAIFGEQSMLLQPKEGAVVFHGDLSRLVNGRQFVTPIGGGSETVYNLLIQVQNIEALSQPIRIRAFVREPSW